MGRPPDDCFFAFLVSLTFAQPESGCAVAARDLLLLVEFGPASRQFFRAHLRDAVVVELPGRIRAPAQWRLHGGAGARGGSQQTQRQFEVLSLRANILRLAGGVAEREIAE